MEYDRERFRTSVDWITYRVTGKIPEYLSNEKVTLKFYPATKGKTPGRGNIHIVEKKTSLCSCYEKEYPKVRERFYKEYDGTNIEELQKKYRKRYNLHRGKAPITRLKDCNLTFISGKGDDRLDVVTAMNKKRYNLCRCYRSEKQDVADDFNRMKANPSYDMGRIQRELKEAYNLRGQKRIEDFLDEIRMTSNGEIFLNGRLVKTDKEIYDVIKSVL